MIFLPYLRVQLKKDGSALLKKSPKKNISTDFSFIRRTHKHTSTTIHRVGLRPVI